MNEVGTVSISAYNVVVLQYVESTFLFRLRWV